MGPTLEITDTLREVTETLAVLERPPCSPGERAAADWLAGRLRGAGVESVSLEDEPSWGRFPPLTTAIGALGVASAALVLSGRRTLGAFAALASSAALLDEAQNGPRIVRRALRRRRQTVNVVARAGDPEGERTLLVLAHHDAAQTGLIFDQTLQRWIHERFPNLLERFKTQPPQWWVGLAAPLGALATAMLGRRAPATAGLIVGCLGVALVADVWRSPTVPGANDNLSGVAVLVALAELLRERPPVGLRVLLVSCGAEETLQDGIRAFMARHGPELPGGRTFVLNYDTVGSPHLVMIEAEGPFWMEDYPGAPFRDLVADCAQRSGVPLERGLRARASTDSVITARAGHPTATLGSITDWRGLANYHLPTDVADNLELPTIAAAARLGHAIAMELAGRARVDLNDRSD
jgi:acetylornithine deacetylase/succinyl-diaminopimelate desuccinylase-like protein